MSSSVVDGRHLLDWSDPEASIRLAQPRRWLCGSRCTAPGPIVSISEVLPSDMGFVGVLGRASTYDDSYLSLSSQRTCGTRSSRTWHVANS